MRAEGKDNVWLSQEVERVFGEMDWETTGSDIKKIKSGFETMSPELMAGAIRTQLDPIALNGGNLLPESAILSALSARVRLALVSPAVKDTVIEALRAVLDKRSREARLPDVWTPSQFAIAKNADASEVVVGIWDSGVDMTLFKHPQPAGIAFTDDYELSQDLLRPLGAFQHDWPRLRGLLKGYMDSRAGVDSDDASQLRLALSNLKQDDVPSFLEALSTASMYVHGTHVAGIAVAGNPFARVFTVSMLWSHSNVPTMPSEQRSHSAVAAYVSAISALRKAGARVVNMSWRYGPKDIEAALTYHQLLGGTAERKAEAARLFQIEKDGLAGAMAAANDLLFIAGAGNEDNSADFEEYVPAGLSLPNLLTVGAVDAAGSETDFSSFGRTVLVHANGAEIDSDIPGGDRMRSSGTSMASPQVANLAAKLIALKPTLTTAEVKDLILRGAGIVLGKDGQPTRVNLINPRRSAALAGLDV